MIHPADPGGRSTCSSLPFGDNLVCSTVGDPGRSYSPLHFTGKERDSESGLDNFGARLDSSALGRFMTPDPVGNLVAQPPFPQSWNLYSYVRNNPLNLTDPTGLWCVWQDGTHDDDQTDGGATPQQCLGQGGLWDQTNTLTGCNSDWSCTNGSGGSTQGCSSDAESCIWQPGDSITVTAGAPGESYGDCIKNDANYFSLQHGVQAISGGHLGNGWVSSALLGSLVANAIETGQAVLGKNSGATANGGASEAFSRGIGPAGVAVAKTIPNVAFSASVAADVSVHSATSSTSASFAARVSGMVPSGTLARAGARLANGALTALGTFKDPFDLSVATFSALVCGVGR